MKRALIAAVLAIVFGAPAARGQSPLPVLISGNTLTAKIQLPGGIGADLTIEFEQVVGLYPGALSLSAALVNPTDPSLLSRLPTGNLVSIPGGFPVLLRVAPSSSSSLSFSGVYQLSLYTHNLTLTGNSPIRLYRAPTGGAFQDMTGFLQLGSVRAGGSGPGFSDFLIVADIRPIDPVIVAKFDGLQSLLSANAASITPSSLFQDLQSRLTSARSYYNAMNYPAAIATLAGFCDRVKSKSGSNIPDIWQANSSDVNVAGQLRSAADTLKFSLTAKGNGAP